MHPMPPGATAPADDPSAWLAPGRYVDSEAPAVIAFAREAGGAEPDSLARAVRLYYAVRDGIIYTPYCDFRRPETYRASAVLASGAGFCVGKAALLAAAARAAGIPARVGFADVRNHLATPRLLERLGTDIFYYHGYTELHLRGRWVKATPAFNASLCAKFGVRPLPFDGTADSLFHPYDAGGRRHMEYLRDRGPDADVPAADIQAMFARHYPRLMVDEPAAPADRFEREAADTTPPPAT
jgi:transglutaminase-like putative cysteine protease